MQAGKTRCLPTRCLDFPFSRLRFPVLRRLAKTSLRQAFRLLKYFVFKIQKKRQRTPMLTLDFHPAGRHFLQIPGPSPVPDRILRAMSYPTIDHRGPEFGALGLKVLAASRRFSRRSSRSLFIRRPAPAHGKPR
jgi:hypothetical protein